jgi:hypothetical protein
MKVPVKKRKGERLIDTAKLEAFWKAAKTGERIGGYVFAIKGGKGGVAPWYVGKTESDFEHDCFTDDKIAQYQEALTRYKTGTALLFFVIAPRSDTAPHKIAELERFLIETAWAANPELLNQNGKKELTWAIPGVTKSAGKGAAPKPVKNLRKALRLEAPKVKPEGLTVGAGRRRAGRRLSTISADNLVDKEIDAGPYRKNARAHQNGANAQSAIISQPTGASTPRRTKRKNVDQSYTSTPSGSPGSESRKRSRTQRSS